MSVNISGAPELKVAWSETTRYPEDMSESEPVHPSLFQMIILTLKKIGLEIWGLLRGSWQVTKARKWSILISAVIIGVIAGVMIGTGYDHQLRESIMLPHETPEGERTAAIEAAEWWGDYGDFIPGVVGVFGVLLAIGLLIKSVRWQRIALVVLMGATVGGLATNCLRLTTGRPRPSAEIQDGFYGLKMSAKYHGFPSGHTATSFGSMVGLAVMSPPLALPALGAAGTVAWARIQERNHYPADVLVGGYLGTLAALLMVAAARRREKDGLALGEKP